MKGKRGYYPTTAAESAPTHDSRVRPVKYGVVIELVDGRKFAQQVDGDQIKDALSVVASSGFVIETTDGRFEAYPASSIARVWAERKQ